ncbi:MAG: hypothetical protein N2053_11835, partial [Chitinispirillaceae bacterium]|nr:hypothetical protein [Chitinispirillaceae bacterium]
MDSSFLCGIPFLALYPEIHFRFFRFFPSLLYKKEPEIIFDTPFRLEPDEDLPLFLIINELHLFPIEPLEVAVTISQGGNTELFKFSDINQYEIKNPLSDQQKSFIFPIPKTKIPYGRFFINAVLTFKKGKKIIKILNDNINTSSKLALICYRASHSLPGKNEGLCCYGDLHFHTQFSQSHVEFGPPLIVIDYMCKSSGL